VSRRLLLPVLAIVLVAFAARAAPGPRPAAAAVTHLAGFEATVAGWTSWYGTYAVGDVGIGWCIDHGLRAPDPDLGYVLTTVDDRSVVAQAAAAWAVSARGVDHDDRVDAAAVMLAVHDLMGATYPYGRLDVDALGVRSLAGFGGQEEAVLERARAIKADALAHADLVGPPSFTVSAPTVALNATGDAVVRVADAEGRPVSGVAVHVTASGAAVGVADGVSGTDGSFLTPFTATATTTTIFAAADPPDPSLHAYAATAAPAQRVAVPATVHLEAATTFAAVVPTTTTSTTTTSTSTTSSTTTTTEAPTTTSTTTTTTAPSTTTTQPTTTVPATPTSTPTTTPASVLAETPITRALPRTGSDHLGGLSATGAGSAMLGGALVAASRHRRGGPD
jgi:hypothetical protein